MIPVISGIYDEAEYCPYCGERISERYANGRQICDNEECKASFYVIEAEESQKEW